MRIVVLSTCGLLVGLGCGGGNSEGTAADAAVPDAAIPDAAVPDATLPDATPTADAQVSPADAGFVSPSGLHHKFVVDDLLIPTSASQSFSYGLNIDGDPQGRPDNAMGAVLSALSSQSAVDIQEKVDSLVRTGGWIGLVDIQADLLTTAPGVGAWWLEGANPSPAACTGAGDVVCGHHLDGNASFSLATTNPAAAVMAGGIVGAKLEAGPSPGDIVLPIPLMFSNKAVNMPVVGARISVQTVTDSSLTTGVIGGAMRNADVQSIYLPALATALDELLATCSGSGQEPQPCGCPLGSDADNAQQLFDEDSNCTITLLEVQNNSLLSSLFAPDVDLFDDTGAFNPRVDGVKDSLSIGYGFSAVGASFADPN